MAQVLRCSIYHFFPPRHHLRARPISARSRAVHSTVLPCSRRGTMVDSNAEDKCLSDSIRIGSWYALPDILLRDYHISVPLNYSSSDTMHITLFLREVIATEKKEQRLPYLLFLQGGPGFQSPRPHEAGGWLKRACKEFRVILLDQVDLPSGGKLSPRGLQLLGLSGLGSSGGFERLHYLLERAWDPVLVQGTPKRLSSTFLRMFENWLSFDTNPLYALMHESIYCQGAASNWAAHRIRDEFRDQFDAVKAAKSGGHVFFTGEMVFPWMFDEFTALKPLKELANFLATKKDWPPLYNETALKSNQVPVAAAAYYEDMYVSFHLSEETANAIAGIRLWVTNEYMHSGLRDDGARILDYLFDMLGGKKLLE